MSADQVVFWGGPYDGGSWSKSRKVVTFPGMKEQPKQEDWSAELTSDLITETLEVKGPSGVVAYRRQADGKWKYIAGSERSA